MENRRELIDITSEVKSQIADIEVAPPLLYKTLFNDLLSKRDLVIEDEDKIVNSILDEKLSKLNIIQEDTSKHLSKLSGSTKKAMDAIKDKDEKKLEEVVKEVYLLREEVDKLKASVFTDTLTKAHNRQWLYSKYMNGAEKFSCSGKIVLIDMDNFKDINDCCGHIAGDKVLEFTAMHLRKTNADLVRYGGDEFILMFENDPSEEEVSTIMHNNRELIIKKELKYKDNYFHISYSYGVASFKNNDNFQDILSIADTHMYEDKERVKQMAI